MSQDHLCPITCTFITGHVTLLLQTRLQKRYGLILWPWLYENSFCTVDKTYSTLCTIYANTSLGNKLLRFVSKAYETRQDPDQELGVSPKPLDKPP